MSDKFKFYGDFGALNKKGQELREQGIRYKDEPAHGVGKHSWYPSYRTPDWFKKTMPLVKLKSLEKGGSYKGRYSGFKSPISARIFEIDHFVPDRRIKEEVKKLELKNTNIDAKKIYKEAAHDVTNLNLVKKSINRRKSDQGFGQFKPDKNEKEILGNTETFMKKYNFTFSPDEQKYFTETMGRPSKVKTGPRIKKLPYCTNCHVSHSIGKHTK